MSRLLYLPRIEPQTTSLQADKGNLPPEGTFWAKDGETIEIVKYPRMPGEVRLESDAGYPTNLLRGVAGAVRTHEAGIWVEVEVYQP